MRDLGTDQNSRLARRQQRLAEGFEALGDVHGNADHRVVHARRCANIASDHHAAMDADAQLYGMIAVAIGDLKGPDDPNGCGDRADGLIRLRLESAQKRHDRIAHELCRPRRPRPRCSR